MPDTRTHKEIKHKATKKIFHNASRGKCAGQAFLGDPDYPDHRILSLFIENTEEQNAIVAVTLIDMVYKAAIIERPPAKMFDECISRIQEQELLNRSIHLFLRNHGVWVVNASGGSYGMFANICKMLPAYWVKMKHYDLALDISIIKADVSIMTGQTEDIICNNIICVVQCLKTMGRMQDAAHIYHALAALEPRIQSVENCSNNAGTAYGYAGDFVMAESMFIRGLYHHKGILGKENLTSLMNLYTALSMEGSYLSMIYGSLLYSSRIISKKQSVSGNT